MFPKISRLFCSLRARLSRQIVLWIFASIIVIETLILIPSYYRREEELLHQLEDISGAIFNSIVRLTETSMTSDGIFQMKVKTLTEDSVILGVIIYDSKGELVETIGEAPEIDFFHLQDNNILRVRSQDGKRYDVALSADYLGINYTLIARHDASKIQRELYAYIGRITVLVIVISVFVTLVIMEVLGVTLINPILKLRDDLIAAGEALSKNGDRVKFYSVSVKHQDKLGEVMRAFNQMFERVSTEIYQRQQAEKILLAEQEKSESLLLNVLPKTIAEKLKEGRKDIAEGFSEVTILFADLVGFTELSEKINPVELVDLLNQIFSCFDELTDKYNLEKIKTIGDAYMVVGGLPEPRLDHAEAIAEIALDIRAAISYFNQKHNMQLSIRIGINTGPVIAGVIGRKKFIYDLWGDAVNTASRMESHGEPNKIQVTESTYNYLKGKYIFDARGTIMIKGKGKMNTYFLVDRDNHG
ncbi:adenylate/guanylate cyclase domain-containing protein [Dapis sp. BLCC M172]|uniref:adenylate/guanylate cyclase domain-containing protein n=1 Tax=Dapis sp. BLCC M172 TaxID=2975281 RepID=UPI003CF32687